MGQHALQDTTVRVGQNLPHNLLALWELSALFPTLSVSHSVSHVPGACIVAFLVLQLRLEVARQATTAEGAPPCLPLMLVRNLVHTEAKVGSSGQGLLRTMFVHSVTTARKAQWPQRLALLEQ